MKKIFKLICACCMCVAVMPAFADDCRPIKNEAVLLSQMGRNIALVATAVPVVATVIPVLTIPDPVAKAASASVVAATSVPFATTLLISKVQDRPDLIHFDNAGYFQCDKHNTGVDYECKNNDGIAYIGKDPKDGKYKAGVYRCKISKHVGKSLKDMLAYAIPFYGPAKLTDDFLKDLDGVGEWVAEDLPWCSDSYDLVSWVGADMVIDSAGQRERAKKVWSINGRACMKYVCVSGYTYNSSTRKCEKPKQPGPTPKSCREQRAGMSDEAIACCDTGSAAVWTGSECKCNGNMQFVIEYGRGKCVPKDNTPDDDTGDDKPEPPVNPKNCPGDAYPSETTCECNNPDMWYNPVKNYCECPDGTKKEGSVCRCTEPHMVLKGKECVWSDEYLSSLKAEIESKYSKVKAVTSTFKVSEWKDAEGNFNTARLASDSIAGVVLGTVGGVVTAHLVKKAQVKQGFEDVQCHIGGQSVAGYGDGFVVGR